jgi:PAS domain S-box-containing protein
LTDRSDEALAAEFQRAAFEASPLAVCVIDLETLALVAFNEATVARYGYSREELAAMDLRQLHVPEELLALTAELHSFAAADPASPFRTRAFRHRSKNGLLRDVELTLCRVGRAASGLAVASIEDVTEQRVAEGALWESEHRLHAVVDSAPIVLWAVDREGVFTLSVGRGLGALGLKPGEVVGRSLFEMYEQLAPQIVANVRRALRGESFSELVSVGELHFDSWYAPLRGPEGEIAGVIGSATDVTERVRAEGRLRTGEERFRSLVENSTDWVMLLDAEARVLYSSPTVTHLFGYAVDEYEDRNIFDFVHSEDMERCRALFAAALATPGGRVAAEARLRHKDGSWREIEAVGVNRLKDASVRAVVVNARDVTDRRRAERLQQAAYRIAESAVAASDLQTLLPRVHAVVAELMPARNLYVALYDAPSGLLSFPYYVDENDERPEPRPPGKGLTEYVLRRGRPALVSHETFLDLVERGEVELVGSASVDWLGVPLRVEGATVGVLAVQSYAKEVRYGEHERDVLTFVSNEIALAIARAREHGELRDSEARKAAVLEGAPDGVIGMDEEGRVTEFNAAAERILGRRREEVLGQPLAELIIPHDLPERHRKRLARYLTSGEGAILERRIEVAALHPDGRRVPVELATTAVYLPGKPTTFTTFVRDLSERSAPGPPHDTLSVVAHELKTPLTMIQGSLQMLGGAKLGESERELLQLAFRGVERMHRLTMDLLDLESAEAGQLGLHYEPLEVTALLREAAEFARGQAAAQGVTLVLEAPPQGMLIEADRERLLQVLANLLANAIRMSPLGERVRLSAERRGQGIRIEVRDNGPGVPEDFRGRLFQRFARAQEGQPGYKGTGLGLAISKLIVEGHGGRIGFEAASGGGALFFFELPQHATPERAPESEERRARR